MSLEQFDSHEGMSLEDIHHDVLLQIEAILFASDSPVSLARLKKHFKTNIISNNYVLFCNSLQCCSMVDLLN